MGKHTPGPWRVDPEFIHDIQTSDGRIEIATVYWIFNSAIPDRTEYQESEESAANARLIAAAPEMLDMLIDLQESAQYWSEFDVPVGIVDRLNAVISKAKGE